MSRQKQGNIRALILIAGFIPTLALGMVLIPGWVVQTTAIPPQPSRLSGDCRSTSVTSFSTIFVIDDAANVPVEGADVAAAGMSQVTNSSGIAVIGGGNFTNFSVSYSHEAFGLSMAGYQSPIVCSGTAYYRVVWLTMTGGSQLQISGETS